MSTAVSNSVLSEEFWSAEGSALLVKRIVLVILGIAALAISAKIKLPIPPSPVPVGMGTFVVLTIGAAYGPRLGLTTIIAYMFIGALGFDVFTNSSADSNGIGYMFGITGGYLVGFVLATIVLGFAARKGWDRNVLLMAIAMLVGTALIYIFGLAWMSYFIEAKSLFNAETYGSVLGQTLAWGLTPFLIGDAIKLALAALLLPALWKLVGKART